MTSNKPIVVIAEKTLHKGQMYGNVSNGGGIINISNGKAIKFIALNENFVTLQILDGGIGSDIKNQGWIKSVQKKAVKKSKAEQVTIVDAVDTEDLI